MQYNRTFKSGKRLNYRVCAATYFLINLKLCENDYFRQWKMSLGKPKQQEKKSKLDLITHTQPDLCITTSHHARGGVPDASDWSHLWRDLGLF